MNCDVGEVTERLENEISDTSPTSQLFSNPSVVSPTTQLILEPFFRFSYVTSSSHNSPGEPPMGEDWKWQWLPLSLDPLIYLMNFTLFLEKYLLQKLFWHNTSTQSELFYIVFQVTRMLIAALIIICSQLSKIYPVTTNLSQIHFNNILPSAPWPF